MLRIAATLSHKGRGEEGVPATFRIGVKSCVIAGLDPAIHLEKMHFAKIDGCPGPGYAKGFAGLRSERPAKLQRSRQARA
jgi:hypothetical protein